MDTLSRKPAWWCKLCGHAFDGGRTLIPEVQQHLQLAHGWIDVSDRWNIARTTEWGDVRTVLETTDATPYETTALIPKPNR